uniref:Protein kinase domain-containing protein n=1 Tax=Odontella aurita TaxID=265563 RepID=A0A7S4MR83_9STRA|mmetsp:Transcript_29392/g.87169  ORF Transcript_29392/g.87169 Transcript_29392/m.87169 type:complete len:466 (+) Transcript_29392:103-1500(+)
MPDAADQRRSPSTRRRPEHSLIRVGDEDEQKLHTSEKSLRRLILLFRTRPKLLARAIVAVIAVCSSLCVWEVRGSESGWHPRKDDLRGARPRFVFFQSQSTPRRNWESKPSSGFHRAVKPMDEQLTQSEKRKKSKWYNNKQRYAIGDSKGRENCKAQYEWQETSFPSCNAVHEVDLSHMRHKFEDGSSTRTIDHINNGGWSDIWVMKEYDGTKRVIKTKLFQHDFTDRNFDRYRRDALVMERLSSYPSVMNIYGFCGVTHLVEYSEGGDIEGAEISADPKEAQMDRLRIAEQVARSIADLHNFDLEGRASVSSTDITPYQFLSMGGKYKLNDFNRARFISWDENGPCPFYVAKNPGKWRAPEEYHYEGEDEKIDVYSAGNIIYFILTGKKPFENIKTDETYQSVKKGKTPHVKKELQQSRDPVTIALLKAMEMCFIYDPNERATAREVANYLTSQLKIFENSASP